MATIPTVVSVREEKDGRFTATIHVLNDGEVKLKKEVSAATRAEFKDKLRVPLQNYLEKAERQEQLLTTANQVIAELIIELGYDT